MKAFKPHLFYALGLAASFVLGLWFGLARNPPAPQSVSVATEPVDIGKPAFVLPEPVSPVPAVSLATTATSGSAQVYELVSTNPRAAMDEALKLPDARRLTTLQNLMAVWLRNDRLAAAEWMTERRGLREFEPLSAQVSDAFFPDDTEMSAMFSFDLSDEKLRDVRVNRLVAYWKSGAHLKFDNSPWEVDGPGTGPAKPAAPDSAPIETAAALETPVAENSVTTETEPKG